MNHDPRILYIHLHDSSCLNFTMHDKKMFVKFERTGMRLRGIKVTNTILVDSLCDHSESPVHVSPWESLFHLGAAGALSRRDFSQVLIFLWGRRAPYLVAVPLSPAARSRCGLPHAACPRRGINSASTESASIVRRFERHALLHKARNRTAIKWL